MGRLRVIGDPVKDEAAAIRQGKGLWGDLSLPRTGWRCIGMIDLGTPSRLCDLCQSSRIRYAHCLRHELSGRTVSAGCVCAGHLLGDPTTVKSNDTWLRGIDARRSSWDRRTWRRSRQGNLYLRTDGYIVTIFRAGQGWSAVVKRHRSAEAGVFQDSPSQSACAAKQVAFELLTRVQLHARTASHAQRTVVDNDSSPRRPGHGWLTLPLRRLSALFRRT